MLSNRSVAAPSLSSMDEATFGDLFDEYATQLYRYVYKLTRRDHLLTEEIVQETFLRAWQRSHIVSTDHNSVRPWLYTVARNLAFDHFRSPASRLGRAADFELTALPDPGDFVVDLLNSDQVARAMARLSAEHRDVLTEIYFHDQTLAGAASRLGVPVGTVKSRLHYAQQAIRFALANPDSADVSRRRPAAGSVRSDLAPIAA